MSDAMKLPELPEPYEKGGLVESDTCYGKIVPDTYSGDQMRAYGEQCARAAVAAERERAASISRGKRLYPDGGLKEQAREFGETFSALLAMEEEILSKLSPEPREAIRDMTTPCLELLHRCKITTLGQM